MTAMKWNDLPRNSDAKVKLKSRDYTLADFLETLIDLDSRLIRHVTQQQFDAMLQPREGLDQVDPYIAIPTYKLYQDQQKNNHFYMVYGNHGEIFFTPYDVLERYVLDEPAFFWDYQLANVENIPHNGRHALSYVFSTDSDAFSDWEASLNYDEIFEIYGLDGGGEKGCLMGFFFVQ